MDLATVHNIEQVDAQLADVVSRARLLQEWLPPGSAIAGTVVDEPELLRQWKDAVAPGGTDWWHKRLRWDGLRRSGPPAQPEDFEPRDWPRVLRQLVDSVRARGEDDASSPGEQLPFEALIRPAVRVARLRLAARGIEPPCANVMTADAYRGLERSLLKSLARIGGRVLLAEFRDTLPAGLALTVNLGMSPVDPGSSRHHDAFVRRHLSTGLTALIHRYPVLGRLWAVAIIDWADATAELVTRLHADHADLVGLGLSSGRARVVEVSPGLGDAHRGGRTVTGLRFDDGTRLVYKPRPVDAEHMLGEWIAWLNSAGTIPPLRAPRVLPRVGYGWMEHVEQASCGSLAAVRRYYRRAGTLLCLLHVLRATDCHFENLVAAGEYPVLVDAETLMYPDPRPLDPSEGSSADAGPSILAASVLRVGLLPGWQVTGGVAYDSSGLDRVGAPDDNGNRWMNVGTDGMREAKGPAGPIQDPSRVRQGHRDVRVFDHLDDLLEGFTATYRLVARRRESLTTAGSLVDRTARCRTRFIYRATRTYASLRAQSLTPEVLSSGVAFGIHLEQLSRAYLSAGARPVAWPVLSAEIRALSRLDIPLLTVRPTARELDAGERDTVRDAFLRAAADDVADQLRRMGEDDLRRQEQLIRLSLAARAPRRGLGSAGSVPTPLEGVEPLGPEEAMAAAIAVAREIAATALPDGSGGVGWVGLVSHEDPPCRLVDVLDDSLYDGCVGVALFLAAVHRRTSDDEWRDLALRALDGTRRRLSSAAWSERRLVARLRGLGAGAGLGGELYGLATTGRLLGGPAGNALLGDAVALARWFNPGLISEDDRSDVLAGAAGALLGLLAVERAVPGSEGLAAAVACAEHLLTPDATGRPRYHRSAGATSRLTGFAHGAAGMAYAFSRLLEVAPDDRYGRAAEECWAFEKVLFDRARGNWPDLRPPAAVVDGGWPVRWCHGAAGGAIARLGVLRVSGDPDRRGEVRRGLETTRRRMIEEWDSLCCGTAGRMETLCLASDVLAEPTHRDFGGQAARAMLRRAKDAGRFRIFPGDGVVTPGLFQGLAGIGYQFLRLADPDLPSVLLLD